MHRADSSPLRLLSAVGLFFAACADGPSTPLTPSFTPLPTAEEMVAWSVASVEPFGTNRVNTSANDGCPIESPDGRSLFIASNRATGVGGIDVWVARRNGSHEPWGNPENAGSPVNSTFDDFCPTPLVSGDLLFVSRRPNDGVCGRTASSSDTDIYLARWHPVQGWLEPENLCAVNSTGDEFSPSSVAAGGGQLFFSSDRGSPGQHGIHVSRALPGGGWAAPVAVAELNAGGNANRPNVSQDGRVIVFDSSRPGSAGLDIWMATRATILDPWSAPFNVSGQVNSPAAETRPSLSFDGRRLYFGSTRAGMGAGDVYLAVRP